MKGFFVLPVFLRLAIADAYPYFQSSDFDNGKFGPYPNRTFISRPDLIAPSLNFLKKDPRCNDGLYTLISLRGDKVYARRGGQSPMILDERGNLVWMNATYGETYDLAVQRYNGADYLTFWQGQGRKQGHSKGEYVMLDSQYREVYRSPPGGATTGDLHEFRITPDNTAISTQYTLKEVDMAWQHGSLKSRKVSIWDSCIQEFDLRTNEVIFKWNASEHFDIGEAYVAGSNSGSTVGDGFDFFHINSIDKDAHGNYLVSSRYYSTLAYIEGRSGKVLWQLGGRHNSFLDLSGGQATNFAYQHHARWDENHTGVHLFDNGMRYGQKAIRDNSRGLHIILDLQAMTAKLKQEYSNQEKLVSLSQGSMQVLPSGNVLLGYGYNAAWVEYSEGGDVLCDVHIGSKSTFTTGAVQTYRVRKHTWTGKPLTIPVIVYKNGDIFISWNGATDVVSWGIEVSSTATDAFQRIATIKKDGFETSWQFDNSSHCHVRAVAINSEGHSIGNSNIANACVKEQQQEGEATGEATEGEDTEESSSSDMFLHPKPDTDTKGDKETGQGFVLTEDWFFWTLVASGVFAAGAIFRGIMLKKSQSRKYLLISAAAEQVEV